MKEYFRDTMETTAAEPGHRIVFMYDNVTLQQKSAHRYAVRYGKQVWSGMTYGEACSELGACLMHQLTCDGWMDNTHGRSPIDPLRWQHKTIDQLDKEGYFMFVCEPDTDFVPDKLERDGMMAGIQVTWGEALIDMGADPDRQGDEDEDEDGDDD